MNVRLAQPQDLRAIQECARLAYEFYVPRIGKRPAPMIADFGQQIEEGIVYVLAKGRDVSGFIVFYPQDDHVHLENVAMRPECQGLGYGIKLIEFAEQEAIKAGYTAIELYTNAKMTENLTLYPYLGYTETDCRHEDGFDRVFYRKELVLN